MRLWLVVYLAGKMFSADGPYASGDACMTAQLEMLHKLDAEFAEAHQVDPGDIAVACERSVDRPAP